VEGGHQLIYRTYAKEQNVREIHELATIPLKAGDSLLVRPTGIHKIQNIGTNRLYAFCVMVANEIFSELTRSGNPEELDEEDLQILSHFS
jgi:hypothetical protein